MSAPSKKKKREETKSNEELALTSAMNSQYNIMHPMINAEHVRVRNPITGLDPLFNTKSDSFRELIVYLCEKGLKQKLSEEFDFFTKNYDIRWDNIKTATIPDGDKIDDNSNMG